MTTGSCLAREFKKSGVRALLAGFGSCAHLWKKSLWIRDETLTNLGLTSLSIPSFFLIDNRALSLLGM